jgi:NAD(P)-dependent dehydrogenase (short-subunit alcohol dehydrogenase family)
MIITGSNTGIGYEAARALASKGANIFLACRDEKKKMQEASDKIRAEFPESSVTCMALDLSSFDSVRTFCEEFNAKNIPLHVLINNAGLFPNAFRKTVDGHEATFQVNHLSHFLLTNLLIDRLKEGSPSRVINVASRGQLRGTMYLDKIDEESAFSIFGAYNSTKLMNVLFSNEFTRRYQEHGIVSNSLHPGVVTTEITRNNSWADWAFWIASPFLKNCEQGAATTVYLAVAPELDNVGGKYYLDCNETAPSGLNPLATDLSIAQKLWTLSEEMTKKKTDK